MLKLVMMSLTGLLVLLIVACGTAAPDVEEAPTAAPQHRRPRHQPLRKRHKL